MKIIILFSILFLISCRSTKEISNTKTDISDSTYIKESYVSKDSIIYIKGDVIHDTIPCDKDTIYIERSGKAQNLVVVKSGKVTLRTSCDSLELIIIKIRQEFKQYKENHKDSIKIDMRETVKTVTEVPKWAYFTLISTILLLAWTFRKVIAKI